MDKFFKAALAFNAGYLLMVVSVMVGSISDPITLALSGLGGRRGSPSFFESEQFIVSVSTIFVAFIASALSVVLLAHAGDEREPLLAKVAAGAYGLYALLQLTIFGLFLDPIVIAQTAGSGSGSARPLSEVEQFTLTVQVLGRLYDISGCVVLILFARRLHLGLNAGAPMEMGQMQPQQHQQQQQQQQPYFDAQQAHQGYEQQHAYAQQGVGFGNQGQEMHSARY